MLGIGIDTGGTCTDAVIYDFDRRKVLAFGKAQTTKQNLEIGIASVLDELPAEYVARAEMIALSTTLATNACVENKGVRARLLMIGFDAGLMDHLKEIYASYGLTDSTQFVILDAKVEGLYEHPFDPDWEDLRKKAKEYFSDCDSVGIVQKHPRGNGGRFELTALKILQEELDVPLTISFDISNEVDILKTCAGTMLNARLIPLITEFMDAVHHVMADRGLDIPISIIRSDGTMMSEDMAKLHPVETILCGPAASVVGGSEAARDGDAVIVDMGGTTTDIAVVRNGVPETARDGIMIGGWKTMVKGLYVETVGLGGDSAVRYDRDGKLFLDSTRVIPLSVLSSEYGHVVPELKELAGKGRVSSSWDHEYFVLLKDISGKAGYTPLEQTVCGALKEKPLSTLALAEAAGRYPRFLSTERLERDGIIIKSGLTPTDMMIIKGDFSLYDGAAARAALECLAPNISGSVQDVPDAVYDLVCRKMYHTLGKLLLKIQYPGNKAFSDDAVTGPVLDAFYEQAKDRVYGGSDAEKDAHLSLTTHFPLIGVGAPVHIFLPKVAELLGTQAVVTAHAGVANALGAVTCRRIARSEQIVKAEYVNGTLVGFSVACDGKRYNFNEEQKEEAVALAEESILRGIRKKAAQLGIMGEPKITLEKKENRFGHTSNGILFEIILTASAEEAQ